MPITDKLVLLARAGHRCIRVITSEEADSLAEVAEAAISLDLHLRVWTSIQGVYDGLIADSPRVPHTENAAAAFLELARTPKPSLFALLDAAAHLASDERALRAWRELLHHCERTGSCVVMLDHCGTAPAVVDAESVTIEVPLPDAPALERLIRETVRKFHRQSRVKAELSREHLQTLVMNLRGLNRRQAERLVAEAIVDDQRLAIDDLPRLLEGKRRLLQTEGILEPESKPASLDDIGGLGKLKEWLNRRAGAFSAEAADFGLTPPRGILLLGVQGGGKSLCAKAVATAWGRPLLRMDVGKLYDRYVGESERRLRAALQQAEMMAPIVLWIDEIEKAFASAASQSSDGGLSRRMFGSLLTWMQEHQAPVFLVATANDIEALPPELLRKGRFDEIFFVDLPSPAAREQILRIHLRKRNRDPKAFDLSALVHASNGYSGAEIEQAIVGALHDAHAGRTELNSGHILRSLAGSPPLSVTMAERMQSLRDWAKGRCVPAD